MNFMGQLLGSCMAAALLCAVYPAGNDKTGGLGTNNVNPKFSQGNAFFGELIMTFLLCFTVFETAVNKKGDKYHVPLAIGMAVFLGHIVLVPIDGCSINPTRTIGPAIVATIADRLPAGHTKWSDMWVFWVGPLCGAALAALMTKFWWHKGGDASDEDKFELEDVGTNAEISGEVDVAAE
jgi:aquaporin PIP